MDRSGWNGPRGLKWTDLDRNGPNEQKWTKWTEVDWKDQVGLRPKLTEGTELVRSGTNGPPWTELDQNGPKCCFY